MVRGQKAADALLDSWGLFAGAVDGAQLYDEVPGVLGAVTGAPVPEMNGVWLRSTRAGPRMVEEVLDRVAASGLPHCLQSRPGVDAAIAGLAAARGMTAAGEVPLMVRDGQPAPRVDSPRLDLVQLAPGDVGQHAELVADCFEMPVEVARALLTERTLRVPGLRCYLGRVDAEPVVTGLGVVVGDAVAVFNIATLEPHRRRGYGAAVTARAVADGLAAGATWALLQSSDIGVGVYERLGFRTVERWPLWVSATAE